MIITFIHVIVPLVPIMEGVVTGFYLDDPIGNNVASWSAGGETKNQCRVTSKQIVRPPSYNPKKEGLSRRFQNTNWDPTSTLYNASEGSTRLGLSSTDGSDHDICVIEETLWAMHKNYC